MKKYNAMTRILVLLLALVLCIPTVLPAAAAESEDIIYIKTAEDLLELAENCRLDTWSQGKTVILQADISLDGIDFQPIPSFGGIFDGKGYTISGLAVYGSVTPAGLFGTIQETAFVQNLTVTGTVSPSGKAENVGGIVGVNYGTLLDCEFTGTIKGKTNVGGIVGLNGTTGRVEDCRTSGSMKGEKMTGGIVGCNLGIVEDCENSSFINTVSADKTFNPEDMDLTLVLDFSKMNSLDTSTAASDTGGIAGYSSGILEGCRNLGTIGYPHVGYNVGGIVGRSCGYLNGCENLAPVYGRKDVGGITGQMEPFIAANLSESNMSKLQRQLEELDGLLNQALSHAGSGMDSVTSRLNSMAGNVGGAASGLKDIKTTATIEGSASGSGSSESSGSITVTPPQIEVEAGGGSISAGGVVITPGGGAGVGGTVVEGEISGGLTEGGVSGEGGSTVGGNVSASTQITTTTSLSGVASALYGLASQMRALSGEMAGVTGVLKTDIEAINQKVNEISDTAYDLFQGNGDGDILIDSSETDIDRITLGKVYACANSGDISGDINIGGITGIMALEYELDPEDDLTSRIDASEQRQYEVKAVIQDCTNTGAIIAKRSYVGGIAGRMDLGLIAQSENYGYVESESGDYVGGIAGVTSSTVRHSFAKCTLSGGSYIGGIVGSGVGESLDGGYSNVVSCCSMVEIPEYQQFAGAICGDYTGSFLENVFVSDTLAGINAMSYVGKAEPISYDDLIAQTPALPEEFQEFTLSFVIEGETVKERTFQYGDSLDDSVYPEIPEKDGYYAYWDLGSLENLTFDTVVTAVYDPYTTALASYDKRENGRPVFYAEGEFDEDAELLVQKQEENPEDLKVVPEDFLEMVKKSFSSWNLYRKVQETWMLTVPEDGLTSHTFRFLPPEGKVKRLAVFVKEDGAWKKVDAEYTGSYLTFRAKGNEVEMALVSTMPVWWVWLIPGVLVLLAAWLLIRLIRRIRRNRKKWTPPQTIPGQEIPVPIPVQKSKKKRWLVLGIALLILALIIGGCVVVYRMNPGIVDGIQACRLIQTCVKDEELAMELTVDAAYGDKTILMEAGVERTQLEKKNVVIIRQSGNALYYCDNVVFLENGKGYQLSGSYPDYSQLLDLTLELFRHVEITGSEGDYAITASGEDAAEILEILVPTMAEKFTDLGGLEIRLETENDALKRVRFEASGTLNSRACSLDATLELMGEPQTQIPQRVQDAILTGEYEATTVVTQDLIGLVNAWSNLERKELLCADLVLRADCGPLKLSEQMEFYRDTSGDKEICSLQKNGYGLYFTDSTVCDRNGLSVSAEQERLADSAQLLDLAYELCQNTRLAVSGGVYTVTLDEEGMYRAASAIAPETVDMDLSFAEGTVEIRLSNGEIESVSFAISGTVKVVVADVPVSLSGQLVMAQTQREFTIPDAVRRALEK